MKKLIATAARRVARRLEEPLQKLPLSDIVSFAWNRRKKKRRRGRQEKPLAAQPRPRPWGR